METTRGTKGNHADEKIDEGDENDKEKGNKPVVAQKATTSNKMILEKGVCTKDKETEELNALREAPGGGNGRRRFKQRNGKDQCHKKQLRPKGWSKRERHGEEEESVRWEKR